MKVKELIKKLKSYNKEAETNVIVHNYEEVYSLTYEGGDGGTKKNCDKVNFYVDRLCQNERINNK